MVKVEVIFKLILGGLLVRIRWDSQEFAGVRNDSRRFARSRQGSLGSLGFAGIREDSLGMFDE